MNLEQIDIDFICKKNCPEWNYVEIIYVKTYET